MTSFPANPPLVAILGPTASGKSALGVWIAEQFNGEVVACDSTQLYRGFDIGTAKPTVEERRSIAHHLVDVLDPDQESTAGMYRELALQVLSDLRSRKKLPVLTVGTGLYLRALLEGLAEVPQRSEELRERLRKQSADHGPGHLHEVLARLDAAAAQKISARDEQKLIRAIEVCVLAQRTLTEVHRSGKSPLQGWEVIKIGLRPGREALYEHIESRTVRMLQHGWLEEIRSLLESGGDTNGKAFDFIGYRELRDVLEGKRSLEEAQACIQQATRNYAKRQMTWFRKESGVHWLEGFGDDRANQIAASALLREQGIGI
jgi:tRNA dimethylallyltransferase